jgi:hypothetical protein
MTAISLEVDLAAIDARWVVVGFGVDPMMDRLPAMLRRLGPHSIWFPDTTTMSVGVPRLSAMTTSAYIVIVDQRDGGSVAAAKQLVWNLAGSERMAVLISIGASSPQFPVPEGTLHVSLAKPVGIELVVAALLLAVTGNGLIGVDFQDIRDCLHATGPVCAWLWRGVCRQTIADSARDLSHSAAEASIPPAGIAGATVITIIPQSWTLHDMVELTGNLRLPEAVDCALAAFTDDGPDPAPAVVALTYSPLQIG